MSDRHEPSGATDPHGPHVRVVRGAPDDVELAALVAGLAAATAWDDDAEGTHHSAWTDRSRQLRRPLRPGPDAWRWSGRG